MFSNSPLYNIWKSIYFPSRPKALLKRSSPGDSPDLYGQFFYRITFYKVHIHKITQNWSQEKCIRKTVINLGVKKTGTKEIWQNHWSECFQKISGENLWINLSPRVCRSLQPVTTTLTHKETQLCCFSEVTQRTKFWSCHPILIKVDNSNYYCW